MDKDFSSVEVKLTPEQKEILLNQSTTYWRKYDVRLMRVYCEQMPLDCFIVQYKIFLSGMSEPQFRYAYSINTEKVKELFGEDFFRYKVLADSESAISLEPKEFDNIEEAADFASEFVHKYDGKDAERVILHVEDNETEETIEIYENANKCDF